MIGRIFRRDSKVVRDRLMKIRQTIDATEVDPTAVAETIGGPMESSSRGSGEGSKKTRQDEVEEEPSREPREESSAEERSEVSAEAFLETYSMRKGTAAVVAYPLYEICKTLCLSGILRRKTRKVLEDLTAVRLPLLLASHNAVGPTSDLLEGFPPKASGYQVASPYSADALRSLAPESIAVTGYKSGQVGAEPLRGWKRMPNVCSWGVEAAVADGLWDQAPVAVAVTDTISALYGVYVSSMLDAPTLDFSYLWKFTKGKPLWRDPRGGKHAIQWTQWKFLRELKFDYLIVVSCLKDRRFKRVVRTLESEIKVKIVPITSEDPGELGEILRATLENQVPMVGDEVHRTFQVEPVLVEFVKRAILAPLPVSDFNEAKSSRFYPLIIDISIE
ncbi:hypothetical protein [Methanopyrus sp. KOL6]|uniref:hypothetical protein n=1 Tax=Methanopyrus sp. KOL6 TaxID=1937004 RepID=UPI000B4ACCA0|nr:hypothetical protein [Methanopyrus sp. KOL6]